MKPQYCIGIDLGGTTTKMGLFDTEGILIKKWDIATDISDGGKNIIPNMANSIKAILESDRISLDNVLGAGLGLPGPVDRNGYTMEAVNIGWSAINTQDELKALLGIPVKSNNDANVAALGEMWRGGGIGFTDIIAITLGTGVGGGIIANGIVMNGYNGSAGELGHIHVEDKETERCNCGGYGCLEQYVSATGVVRLAKRALIANPNENTILRDREVTAKLVFEALADGDVLAGRVVDSFGDYLGKALAIMANIVNPEAYVIGGGVSKAGTVIIDSLLPSFKKNAFPSVVDTKFLLATLGNDAGIYGATKLLIDSLT